MLMEMCKKYNNFTELYQDYGDIIDAEFEKRHLFRLNQIIDSIGNRQKWVAAHITGFQPGFENDKLTWKLDILDEVYQAVMKEVHLKIHTNSLVDREIEKFKNRIVDLFVTNELRGTENYHKHLLKAKNVADIFEYSMKAAYYNGQRANSKINDDEFTKEFSENLNRRLEILKNKSYMEENMAFTKFLEAISKLPYEEVEKFVNEYNKNNNL